MPSARPKPWANAVLPAPISPASTTMSPGRHSSASAPATAWVAATEGASSESRADDVMRFRIYGAADGGSRPDEPPGGPAPDAARDLVTDRAQRRGPVRGPHLVVALTAEQHHFVAGLHGCVAAVDQQLVHRDRADDRVATPTDQHLGARTRQVAPHTVGIADRHRGNRRLGRDGVAQPVRQPLAGGEPLDERHPRLERHHRAELAGQVIDAGAGRDAVDRDTGPDERVAGRRVGQRTGRVGGMHHVDRWEAGPDVGEQRQLGRGLGTVGLVGHREVGEQAGEMQVPGRRDPLRQRRDAGRRGAHPVHAGVDLDVDAHRRVRPRPTAAASASTPGVVTVGIRSWSTSRPPTPTAAR